MLAGFAVTAAISLGAWIVYARARDEKIADIQRHVEELAVRFGHFSADTQKTIVRLPEAQRAPIAEQQVGGLKFIRDNSEEVRRIYTFALDDTEKLTRVDTGRPGEAPSTRPLPPHALQALKHYLHGGQMPAGDAPWITNDGVETTAFALILDAEKHPVGAVGIEADVNRLQISIASIRQSLLLTCLLAVAAGAGSAFVVHRIRERSAVAQELLEETHRTEEAIIMSLGEAVYTFDPRADRFRWRGNAASLLGFPPDPDGESREAWCERLHPDDRLRYEAALDEAARESLPMQIEYRVHRSDDSWIWVLDRNQPVQTGSGGIQFAGALTDLTAEETLRLFFDESATAHVAFDGDSIVDANPAAVALFGAPDRETLLAQPVQTLWPRRQPTQGLSAVGWSDHVLAALETGIGHFEWQFVRLDGSLVDCDVFLRHALFQEREVLLIACYDISSTKHAQAQLIASEQRFRDVSEAIGEFIWEVDCENRYTYASRRVIEVLGLDPEAVMGRTPFEFVPEEDLAGVREKSEAIFGAGMSFRHFEHRVRRSDGSLLWISVSGVPSYDSSGKIIGYRGASLDITQHRAYEQELLLQKEAAETAGRAKGNFLAMMSHEIRTPLNSVLGFADLVLDTSLTHTQRDYLQTIKGSGDALLVLLNDILDFSKIESGRLEVEIRAIDLPQCIREVLDLHQPHATGKRLSLAVKIAADLPRYVLSDGSRLRQILVNLVGNAVKFTSQGGVVVSASFLPAASDRAEGRIRIVVSDTGIGIRADQRERLFQPFTQADSSTTRRFGGTGLGLAISKRLSTLLGGDLGIEDRDAPGAAFYLELPAILPTEDQIAGHAGAPDVELFSLDADEYFTGRPPRVLIVDDNTLNRRLTSHLLHHLGAESDTAASAAECFEKVASERFDLVLMDVQMPGMDGLEATRHIRSLEVANDPPLAIVALTADAMLGDRERCMEAGMNDYLTKPLRRDALSRVLHAYTRRADA
ncbi:MAG: PAS domain S-box protein [Terrimicrobiaceae bacterium]|nr:PAS domain S-box protein [Terrimicrobiaceae bacterium]